MDRAVFRRKGATKSIVPGWLAMPLNSRQTTRESVAKLAKEELNSMDRIRNNQGWVVTGVFVLFAVAMLPIAHANVCDEDIETVCGHIQAGKGVADCLESNKDKVSLPCRQLQEKLGNSLRDLKSACAFDVVNYCRDVKPGYGRVKTCLMNNLDKLSNDCQVQLKKFQP